MKEIRDVRRFFERHNWPEDRIPKVMLTFTCEADVFRFKREAEISENCVWLSLDCVDRRFLSDDRRRSGIVRYEADKQL
jgi:hypothetical protein